MWTTWNWKTTKKWHRNNTDRNSWWHLLRVKVLVGMSVLDFQWIPADTNTFIHDCNAIHFFSVGTIEFQRRNLVFFFFLTPVLTPIGVTAILMVTYGSNNYTCGFGMVIWRDMQKISFMNILTLTSWVEGILISYRGCSQ